jgi:hypothetical protein
MPRPPLGSVPTGIMCQKILDKVMREPVTCGPAADFWRCYVDTL